MRNRSLVAVAAVCLALSPAAYATVNHGDFNGTDVDFLAVSETTTTAGDPEPLWGAPTLAGSGNQLLFFPPNYTSSCTSGGSDTTASDLTMTLQAQAGVHIDLIALQEAGDANLLTFPPYGTSATNVSAAVSGTVTVTEDINGPISPVVIPFSGTFTPSSSFALPTNYGTSQWTGNVSVDVASVVPNATRADVSLTNALASNCGAGSTSATIQKKVVSGPAVSLMVNPLPCDLQLDKTCCVTQQPLADLDVCQDNDDIVSLKLKYTGDKCGNSSCDQGHHFKCWGKRDVAGPASVTVLDDSSEITATPSTGINVGDEVTFTSSAGILGDHLKFKTLGNWFRRQYVKIDTSCDRAITCGDQFGAWKVTGVETALGGVIDCSAPPPPPECVTSGDPVGTSCDAKLVDMVLQYNGQPCQDPLANPQNGEADCEGDATGASDVGIIYTGKFGDRQTETPASGINDGDLIRVTATFRGGLFPNQEFKIVDSGGVLQTVKFHVSCSQPLALGDEFGSLKLVEFTTKNGTHVALGSGDNGPFDACEVPLAPPGPHCTSQLKGLTLVYIGDFLGEGCTVSNDQGGYASCSGVADPGDPIDITWDDSQLAVEPADQVEFGDLVDITAVSGGDLGDATGAIHASGAGGTQTIQVKTNCWKPLNLGDRFGGFVVFGMDREDDGPITLGGNVQYQYTVTNPNADPVDNVQVVDDQLGVIASGVSIPAGGTQTFKKNATLYGTTTNVATATGDVAGDVCTPGTDSVDVSVLAPGPGPFECSAPLTGFTMIWNGAQTVDLKVWSDASGTSTLLHTFDNIAPGDAVEVTGLSGGTPTIEIFDDTGTTKLGESKFDLTCEDWSMNGVEDCGKNEGNLKSDDPGLVNDWLLEGMVDSDATLSCTPGLVPSPPACGFGPELIVLMPGLMWWHRRRLRKER